VSAELVAGKVNLNNMVSSKVTLQSQPLMVDVKADLRERLLLVAIRLFAERGVEAVSMRTINTEAGTKNKSAVHYHFGNKAGILAAIFEWIKERVEPAVEDLWMQIEQRDDKDDMSIQELLLVLYAPLILVQQIPNCGLNILKLWSKMLLDSNVDSDYVDDVFQVHLLAVVERLSKRLPEKNKEHLRFQTIHSVFSFIAGSATLDSKIVAGIENAQIEDSQEMLFAFIDYASGGISNTQATQEKIDVDFWEAYFSKHGVVFE